MRQPDTPEPDTANVVVPAAGTDTDTDAPDGPDVSALLAELARREVLIENLQSALATRSDIGRALGVLEERYGIDDATAFAVLVRLSNERDTKLHVIATEFLATRQLPAHIQTQVEHPLQPVNESTRGHGRDRGREHGRGSDISRERVHLSEDQ